MYIYIKNLPVGILALITLNIAIIHYLCSHIIKSCMR